MTTTDKETALSFYCYLCNVIGTAAEVRTRRQLYDAYDQVGTMKSFITITSGSKGEGLDLPGSDLDVMYVYSPSSDRYIYETSDKAQKSSKKRYLVMNMRDTKPGFTKLSLKNATKRHFSDELYVQDGEDLYLSNKEFKQVIINYFNIIFNDLIIHGPCVSSVDERYDNAFCLYCQEWISPANPWVMRSRVYWPSGDLISNIVKHGILLVPIGCKHSDSEELEWRMSFSIAEKQLIYSFEHTQLLCYALLKILLKEIINKNEEMKDLLCSYFLKTIMFWVSEEVPISSWKPDNILSCFMSCLQRLIYCVEIYTCPHYFIPENNLFGNKIHGFNQIRLLACLKSLYNTGWQCLFWSETVSQIDFTEFLGHNFIRNISDKFLNPRALINSVLNGVSRYVNMTLTNRFGSGFINLIKCRTENRDLYIFLFSLLSQAIAQTINIEIINNKYQYKQYRECLYYLLIGIHNNVVSGWLLLASLFFMTKQYRKTLVTVSHVLSLCTTDNLHVDNDGRNRFERTSNQTMRERKTLTKHLGQSIPKIVLFPLNSTLMPYELYTCCGKPIPVISTLVYAYFLRFLCFYQLHDTRNLHKSLMNLRLTIRKRFCVDESVIQRHMNNCEKNPTYSALGIALQMAGDWKASRVVFSYCDNCKDRYYIPYQFTQIIWPYLENILMQRLSSAL